MGATTERQGFAGAVAGPFLVISDLDGFPKKAIAAFIREEDREVFLAGVRIWYALQGMDMSTVKEELKALQELAYKPVTPRS